MKKNSITVFLFKCILASLPLLVLIGYTVLFPLAYMDAEYPAWAYSKEISHTVQTKQQDSVLILGDSRAMADILPTELGDNVQNLAVGGATTIEMYYTLSNYLKHNEAPTVAVVMFAPFHYSYMDNFWERTVYFNYLSASELSEVFSNARQTASETVLTESYLMDALSCRLRLPNKYLPALTNSRLIMRYSDNKALCQQLVEEKGHGLFGTADGSSDLNYEVNYTQMQHSGDAALIALYLDKLLALCKEQNIQVILEQPPMNEASYAELQDSYLSEYTIYIEETQTNYPDFLINSEIPCYENRFFGDSSHLNEAGAAVYTEEFKSKYADLF